MEEFHPIITENRRVDLLNVLDTDAIYRSKLSNASASNTTSQILLENAWEANKNLMNAQSSDLLKCVNINAQNYANANTWKSNLSNSIEPISFFEKSLQTCTRCSQGRLGFEALELMQSQKCVCNIDFFETNLPKNEKQFAAFSKLNSACDFDTKPSEERHLFRPKFGHAKISTIGRHTTFKSSPYQKEDVENEETKSHKSNVSKISFKTAKEQFLAANPGAKRTLGTSRKAQSKFVSPMIGAQEKQEQNEPEITDERLKHLDPKMIELIESEIIDKGTPIGWDDIAGLHLAKSVIQEAVVWPLLRPDIFTGLRRPPKGILLFGPPGTGKTLIGKCIASQCSATFFSISASSLTSKWIGDGEKMVRALFAVARCRQPAVVFIDEIDSLLTQRNDTEHEATRRIKTEFLVQFDGAGTGEEDRLLIVGATNRPQELDEAARRRLVKRLYIPLPDIDARKQIILNLLKNERNELSGPEVDEIARLTDGYSGADMKSLCSEAAMGPVRAVPFSQIITINTESVRPVIVEDFKNALQRVRPSVSQDDLGQYVKWNKTYGQGF